MYKKILVPLDGSKTAEGVLPHAKALAYSEKAELILINVVANPAFEFAFSDPSIAARTIAEEEELGSKYMAEIEERLKSEGYKVTSLIKGGSAANTILKTAEEMGADIIAMSTHGRTGPAHWVIGSVAEKVVHHSKIPVMLIRSNN
ncbi:MAG TPA: universal stress protein [Dehalococcoidia bacterium]|nr:universal stress protein [Dehalococcoidia bacterium]